jgi:OFA family oxalate/formate antiporter-like MFS transporter
MQERYRQWLAGGSSRRWMVVVGSILINMALGVIYAWSVFRPPLAAEFKWAPLMATGPFTVAVLVFALLMIPAGRLNDRLGPTPVGIAGGVLMGISFILCSLTPQGAANSVAAWWWLVVCYGVLGGAAIGLGYAVPIATGVKWFPDKRGLITGLSVMGFGGSTLVFGPLANTMIANQGVWNTFSQLGIVFFVMVTLGSLLLTTPPAGWRPAGWTPPGAKAGSTQVKRDFSPGELLRTSQTYMLIGAYALAAMSGLMVISFAKPYLDSLKFNPLAATQGLGWINAIPVVGYNIFNGKSAELSAALVGWLSLWNALGRMLLGWVSDRIGRRNAMLLDHATIFVVMLITPWLIGSAWAILLMFMLIGMTFGGNLALFPATNADWFGTKHAGVNYGIIFLGYGLAGVVGSIVGNLNPAVLGGYETAFRVAAVAGLIAGIMSYLIKPPARLEQPAPAK